MQCYHKCRKVIRAYCVVKTAAERQRSGSDWRHTAAFAAGAGVFYFAAAFWFDERINIKQFASNEEDNRRH